MFEVDALAMSLASSAESAYLSRAKALERSMDAISIGHFRRFKADLRKMARLNGRQHGHAWRVKRVFALMAMPPNDEHFEVHHLLDLLDFLHFACFENVCAEAVLAND